MVDSFFQASPQIQAALISAIVSLITALLALLISPWVRHAFDKRSVRHRLKTEYEYEERKKLRTLIGRYHGRILEAAVTLNHRFWNLYANEGKGWLDLHGKYNNLDRQYYFRSTVYRFLAFCSLSRLFEAEAIFVDSRIAEPSDLEFVKYLKAPNWVSTDVALYEGLEYNSFYSTDHFFADQLRVMCDSCSPAGTFLTIEEFELHLKGKHRLEPMLRFFDGLKANENRFRWSRIVAFHLVLMAFINALGYDMQRSTRKQFEEVAARLEHAEMRVNLKRWLPRLGLESQAEAKLVKHTLESAHA